MAPDIDTSRVDDAAEDPPLTWLALSVIGVALAAVGLVATVVGALGFHAGLVAAIPLLAPLFDLSVVVLIVGVGLFVVSMTEWSPDVSE